MNIDQRNQLLNGLNSEYFTLEDLAELCFILGVDWDNIAHETKRSAAIAIIHYFTSRSAIGKLVNAVRQARPNVDLSLLGEVTEENLAMLFPPRGQLPDPGPLPAGSNVPFWPNAVFTGRVPDLLQLADTLIYREGSGRVGVTQPEVVSGLGGIGKTQLAVEFCYRYGRWLDGVHWILAAREEDIEPGISACGIAMALPYWPDKQDEQVAATLHAWTTAPNRLVVLDNLEDPTLLRRWLPKMGSVRVLVTTRIQHWPTDIGMDVYRLNVLHRAESRSLLRRLARRLETASDEELDPLAEKLGDLPLAIHLAGCYLEECQSTSVAEYLAELEKAGSLLEHDSLVDWTKGSPTGHLTSLQATFAVSWKRLEGDGTVERLARVLFQAAGYCAPNTPIPDDLLWSVAEKEGAERPIYERARRRLSDLGLVEAVGPDELIHPLLVEYAQTQPDPDDRVLAELVRVLGNIANTANDTGLPTAFAPLLPHVELISPVAEAANVESAIALWGNLGYHKDMVGEYHRAREWYERALDIAEMVYGPEHPTVSNMVNNLGSVLQTLGDYPGAKAYYERALDINEKVYGLEHPKVAGNLNNLGNVLQALGDYSEAKAYFERALDIAEMVYGPEHPEVATFVNNLGMVLQDLGDYPGAKACYERALDINEKVYGLEHPKVAGNLSNLGNVLGAQGDYPGAKACCERALDINEMVYGPEHPEVARNVNNLGRVLQDLGDYPGAKVCFERALCIAEKFYGPEHPEVATMVSNLGGVLHELGDYHGAKACFERALDIFGQFLPAGHPAIQVVRKNLDVVERKISGISQG